MSSRTLELQQKADELLKAGSSSSSSSSSSSTSTTTSTTNNEQWKSRLESLAGDLESHFSKLSVSTNEEAKLQVSFVQVLTKLGRFGEAVVLAQSLASKEKSSGNMYRLACAQFYGGLFTDALGSFKEALQLMQKSSGSSSGDKEIAAIEKWIKKCSDQISAKQERDPTNEEAEDDGEDPEPSELEYVKFPRTRHIFDAGGSGVGRDDLLMEEKEVKKLFMSGQLVTVEEKVDGANLGFSIALNGAIQAQNRSHFVNSSTQTQFKTLDAFIAEHTADLYEVLEGPGKFMLFGEWLYAVHSIFYEKLPSYFLVFDIYDCEAKKFLSVSERNKKLENTSFSVVPAICQKTFTCMEEFLQLLDSQSKFRKGFVEGIYLRVDEGTPISSTSSKKSSSTSSSSVPTSTGKYLSHRAKLVRADFIQGITTHWSTASLRKNVLNYGTEDE